MYGSPEGSIPGQLTATRLLPHGHAFFLTPSFLIAEPERAYQLLIWFQGKHANTTPGTWKLVCAYNIRQYLLDLAIEKSAEKDEVEAEYQGQARKDSIMEERGLGYTTCLLRFQMHDAVVKMLSQSRSEFCWDNDSSDIADEFMSPIIYADKFIEVDDEQALVTWFASWAMCKLDLFRKFTVVGTAPKSEKKAVRRKQVTLRAQPPRLGETVKGSRGFRDHPAISAASGPLEISPTSSKNSDDEMLVESASVPGRGNAITAAIEMSPASPPNDSDVEMSIDSPSVSGRDTVAPKQATVAPISHGGTSIPSPPQLDYQSDERPTSASRSRAGIQPDERGRRLVPFSVRPDCADRPVFIPKDDDENHQHPNHRAAGGEVNNGNVARQEDSDVANRSDTVNDLDTRMEIKFQTSAPGDSNLNDRNRSDPLNNSNMMDIDSPAVEEGEITSGGDEKHEVTIKEIKYEATTMWYQRRYKEGKAWEHIYVDSCDKAMKYLGVK